MRISSKRRIHVAVATCATIISLAAADRRAVHAPPVLRPGSPDLNLTHIRERSDSVQYFRPDTAHPGSEKLFAASRFVERLIDHPRGPALLLVSQARGYSDSTIVLRSNLKPIVEYQNYFARHRRLVYEYAGDRVSIRDSTLDSAVKVREHTYDGDVFNFNQLNLILRSVPLREGYEAILPLYSEGDDALEMDTVKVLGKDKNGAWRVRFADPVIFTITTLDPTTREMLMQEGTTRRDGVTGRMIVIK